MSEKACLEVAENSLSLARSYVAKENFGRAFSHYLVSLKLNPVWKSALKEEFSTVLCKWGNILEGKKRLEDLFNCYKEALDVFPENEIILNNLGAHLLRVGLLKESEYYFRKSLLLEPCYVKAARNLENVSNLAVERWHFRMLNDRHRNECFREAVLKKIQKGFDSVLDVGTGTGILSLFAVEGGAKEIFACDSSSTMTEIAQQVFSYHNASQIKLINKHSSQLTVGSDTPEKVSLLVTETLDSGLFGEGILSTLTDAWDRLLLPPSPNAFVQNNGKYGFVIPFSATLYITGVQCDEIFTSSHPKPSNLDLIANCDQYDTVDLKRVDHKILTNVYELIKVNFNDPVMLKELMMGVRDREHKLRCEAKGRLDCFAVWFELWVDEDVKLNTGPSSRTNEAWDQAVFLLPKPQFIEKEQEIKFHASFKNGKLTITSSSSQKAFVPSVNIIKTLNDDNLQKQFSHLVEKFSDINKPLKILDCFSYPFFGISFLKNRKNSFEDRVFCVSRSEADKALLQYVFNKNNINNKLIEIIEEDDLEKLLEINEKFDLVLMDLVEGCGELNERTVSLVESFRSLLNPGGIFIPQEITTVCQFIYSDWLEKVSKVESEVNTCGYTIHSFLNKYQTTHHIDLRLKPEEQIVCSNAFNIFNLFAEESTFQTTVKTIPNSPKPNAIVYWFSVQLFNEDDKIWTNRGNPLYGRAAFLFPELPEDFSEINLRVVKDGGFFLIKIF